MVPASKEVSFVINLSNLNSLISRNIDAGLGAVHGIGFTEYMILFHLNNAHKKTMRRIDLANSIGLTASGITRVVSPMEKIGLVQKEENPRDARVSLVKISSAGEEVLNDATVTINDYVKRLLENISGKQLNHALEVFKAIGKDVYV
jgi:DNA-binding MarR family transcriptional regulator